AAHGALTIGAAAVAADAVVVPVAGLRAFLDVVAAHGALAGVGHAVVRARGVVGAVALLAGDVDDVVAAGRAQALVRRTDGAARAGRALIGMATWLALLDGRLHVAVAARRALTGVGAAFRARAAGSVAGLTRIDHVIAAERAHAGEAVGAAQPGARRVVPDV